MRGSHCRLYDENLVRNIMITTSISIMEFVKKNMSVNSEDVCEYIEYNADDIISETIKNLNHDDPEKEDSIGGDYDDFDQDLPPLDDDDGNPWE